MNNTKKLLLSNITISQTKKTQENYESLLKTIALIEGKNSDLEKNYRLTNSWRYHYQIKPPSTLEFLSSTYLGGIAKDIFPHIKETFKNYNHPLSDKRVLVLSSCIGAGKSFLSSLMTIFVIVHLSYLISPKQFYRLNLASPLVISFLSFTLAKAAQVLLVPCKSILKASPIFHKITQEDGLENKQSEIPENHIAYTTAGKMGDLQFNKDIHVIIQSDSAALLGLSIIFGIASEISFWLKRGISSDTIWESFTDLRERINSRFFSRYLTGVILDSSPLDLSVSPIDKWIFSGEAVKDPEVMVINERHWDIFPDRYPKWKKTGKTFFVYRGSAAKPPIILNNKEQVKGYPADEIIKVPIDKFRAFKNNLKKEISDYAAYPAGGISKYIDNWQIIEEIFDTQLDNVYISIQAPASKAPEGLIWNQVKDLFFLHHGNEVYYPSRAPMAPRVLSLDLSAAKDTTAISCAHLETNPITGENVIVFDFTIPIVPTPGNRINLAAITNFIIDCKKIGRMKFHKVVSDTYQSENLMQNLKRQNIDVEFHSVDRSSIAYFTTLSMMLNKRIKIGKNIILKNNLKSLIDKIDEKGNQKIDHTSGSLINDTNDLNWNRNLSGIHAKDVSDSVASVCHVLMSSDLISRPSKYMWIEEKKEEKSSSGGLQEDILDQIKKHFCLATNNNVNINSNNMVGQDISFMMGNNN